MKQGIEFKILYILPIVVLLAAISSQMWGAYSIVTITLVVIFCLLLLVWVIIFWIIPLWKWIREKK